MWFKNLDKLIKHVNQRQAKGSNINIFYSTPACYLYSLNKANKTWTVKQDDFFPYAHRENSFWTGYFTSRANLKYNVRKTNTFLQAVRQIAAIAQLNDESSYEAINNLERAMGVSQHHDAVSGTEKQHVAFDYAKRLSIGVEKSLGVIENGLNKMIKDTYFDKSNLIFCSMLNISECIQIENSSNFASLIYNPMVSSIETWLRIPIVHDSFRVYDGDSLDEIISEIVEIDEETKSIPERNSAANYDLVFKVGLDPLKFKTIFFKNDTLKKTKNNKKKSLLFKNEHLQLSFDLNGNLNQIVNLDIQTNTIIKQSFCYYNSFPGNNSEGNYI
jgi:lysosomal alpha-mannosidase